MQSNTTALGGGKRAFKPEPLRCGFFEKTRASLHRGEVAGAQGTIEYVVVIGVAVAVGALLFTFKGVIGQAVTKMTTDVKTMFGIT